MPLGGRVSKLILYFLELGAVREGSPVLLWSPGHGETRAACLAGSPCQQMARHAQRLPLQGATPPIFALKAYFRCLCARGVKRSQNDSEKRE